MKDHSDARVEKNASVGERNGDSMQEPIMRGMGGLGDLSGLMKEAQKHIKDFQKKLQEVEGELAERVVEGSAGGGMVKVLFNGKQEPLDVQIDPAILKEEDPEFVQEMVLAAIRQGLKKSKEIAEEEKGKLTGGLNLPGLSALL